MGRMRRGKIGLGAELVVVALFLFSTLAAAQEGCPPTSTLSGDWSYPSDWCYNFGVTADQATVNPGATASFTIGPPCPGATCTVASNSGCAANKFTGSVSEDGSKASVVVGPTACGSLDVTVTKAATASCPQYSVSTSIRINNTGQGGGWVLIDQSGGINPGGCCGTGGGWTGNCTVGKYRLAAASNPNSSAAAGCFMHCPPPANPGKPPDMCITHVCSGWGVCGPPPDPIHIVWLWGKWEWKCTSCN